MALIDQSVHIAAPIEAVWDFVHDASRRGEWDARIAKCEVLSSDFLGASVGAGTRLRYHLRWLPGIALPLRARYAAFVPHQRAAIAFESLPWWQLIASAVGAWHLTPTDHGTLFRSTFRYRLKLGPIGRWIDRLLCQSQVERDTQRSLAQLKKVLESRT